MSFIKEIETFKMSDAVEFHDRLNPKLFINNKLFGEVRIQLKAIADDFMSELGINNIHVKDLTISGSNAAFSYTKHSDLDLHIVVDMDKLSNDQVYRELFASKKTLYNDTHNVTIRGIPVEVYVQDFNEPVKSIGEYSVAHNKWIRVPSKRRANLDQTVTKAKFEKISALIDRALKSTDLSRIQNLLSTIHRYRKAGLDRGGEFSPENLVYKCIRSNGQLTALYARRDQLHSKKLSIEGQYTSESASGYIPSNAQKNDPRYKTALTVDVKPNTMQQNAKKLGWKIARDGTPPKL